jgi:microcystin-dependent protein/outer membrane murein-binding lipoprotein Lpp
MSIIERTTKLQLTQFEGSSINPAILDYYTADMAIIDGAFSDADTRLSALESTFQGHADRLSTLEAWKDDTVDPTLGDYGTRIGALETWKDDTVTVTLADHADRLTALETWKTDTVTVELASLDGRVDAIEQIIHDLSVEGYYDLVARLDALEAKVETNSNDITTLNANLTRLGNRLTEDEGDIVNLGNGIVALANRVTLLEGCCEEVRGVLADHNTRINKNASDIAELDARLTRDEANISGNASDIVILANQNSTQSDQIQDLYDKYNSIDPDMPTNLYSRVGALETIVGDDALQTTAQTVTGAINELFGHATDVDADEVDYSNSDSGLTATDVQGAIDEVNSKVEVDAGRIGALETTVGGAGSGLVKAVNDLTSESTQIQLSVSQLSASVIGIGQRVDTLESTVGDASAGLVKDVADLQTEVASIVLPSGMITPYGGVTAPSGWLLCDGSAVNRETYADLFTAIGTAFGSGDGSTTFNVPDMRECTAKGAGLYGGTVGAHVDSNGLAVGEFLDDRVQSHTHTYTERYNAMGYVQGGTVEMYNDGNATTVATSTNNGRYGDTTEVKSIGVNYIIKI